MMKNMMKVMKNEDLALTSRKFKKFIKFKKRKGRKFQHKEMSNREKEKNIV